MSALSLSLLSRGSSVKNSISPQEFWNSYPMLALHIAEIFGGRETLEKIPVFPLEDLEGRSFGLCCCKKSYVKSIEHPVEIYFDSDGKKSGAFLAYKIKIVKKPKFRFVATKVQKGIEMIHFLPQPLSEKGYIFRTVFTKGGPASEKQDRILPLLKTLLYESDYEINMCCFSLFQSKCVTLDI